MRIVTVAQALALVLVSFYAYSFAGLVRITPPTIYENNSPILANEIQSYEVCLLDAIGGNCIETRTQTSLDVTPIPASTRAVIARAVSVYGIKSDWSVPLLIDSELLVPTPPTLSTVYENPEPPILGVYTRATSLTPYPNMLYNNISSLEYNPDTNQFVALSNSPGGKGAIYNADLTVKIQDFVISINNADSEDLTHISGNVFAYCDEQNVVEEFNIITGERFGKYLLPGPSLSNKGFEGIAYDKATGDYWVVQESPMVVYKFPRNTSMVKTTYDLTQAGYSIPFDLASVVGAEQSEASGLYLDGDTLIITSHSGNAGKLTFVSKSGVLLDTFADLPGTAEANNYEAVTKGPNDSLFVGSEPQHWLRLDLN